MAVLLLRLAGPMQSWGVQSRFTVRRTELAPTKSGVIGLLAAALGRRRTDSLDDLQTLSFGVRKDQPGTVIRDFHTAHTYNGTSMPLSNRHYLADAVYLAGFEGDESFLEKLDEALRHPVFPLYLGRRSCPPTLPLSLGLRHTSLLETLTEEPWQASQWFRQRQNEEFQPEILIDAELIAPDERKYSYTTSDVPISFDSRRRDYGSREVERVLAPAIHPNQREPHDPMLDIAEAAQCS